MFDNQHRPFVALSDDTELCFVPKMMNRHRLIARAAGTGKTVSLQTLAETFSEMGVPVFVRSIFDTFFGR
jgi:DNA helicase HerA-like ATPase